MHYLKYISQFFVVCVLAITSWIFYTWFLQKEEIAQQNVTVEEISPVSAQFKEKNSMPEVEKKSNEEPPTPSSNPTNDQESLRGLASLVSEFKELPTNTDQEWVLENAANSLKAGLIEKNQLPTHISELSSIRMFTVLDRTSPYVDSESFDGIEPELEEGL